MSLIDEIRALVASEVRDEVRRVLAQEGPAFKTPPVPAAQLWTVDEVAAFLRMSRSWVYDQAEAGLLPSRQLGRSRRFDPDEVHAFARGEAPALSGGARVLPMPGRGR